MRQQEIKTSTGFTVSPREMVEFVVNNWFWFVLSIFVSLSAVYIYLLTIPNSYKHSTVIMVKADGKGCPSDIYGLSEIQSGYTGTNISNEVYILKSYKLISEIVSRLHLDVTYEKSEKFRKKELYKESPVEVTFFSPYTHPIDLEIRVKDNNSYEIESAEGVSDKLIGTHRFGEIVKTSGCSFSVALCEEQSESQRGEVISVRRSDPQAAALLCQSSIAPSALSGNSSLIKVECTGENIRKIDDILATLIDVYNEAIVEDRNRIALNTARFIDERIVVIGQELGEVEDELTELKQRNIIVNSATASGTNLSANHGETRQIETNLYIANHIKEYLHNAANGDQLIPNVTGVGDANIQTQIGKYNELMLQRNRLLSESGENNIVVKDLEKNISELRDIIDKSMNNYIQSLNIMLSKARSSEQQTISNLQMIPKQEHMALSVARQQSIKESLYTYLLNKREETALQLAVTEADVRVIETPFGSNSPIAPKRRVYFLIAAIIAFVIPIFVKLFHTVMDITVKSRKDIETYTTIPQIGAIPEMRRGEAESDITNADKEDCEIRESFKMLRSNIRLTARDAKVIMVTSTMSNEGKSFISRNTAITLALSGKRVVLIDADLRKRSLSHIYNMHHADGLSSYLSEMNDNIDEIITTGVAGRGVDTIFAGPTPPNPSELFISNRFDTLIEELKRRYDYIIIDSVPALSLSETAEINRLAEMTIYVVRCNALDKRYLTDIEKLHKEEKLKRMYIVLNYSSTKYGYGYGYRYRYGYKYGYSSKNR